MKYLLKKTFYLIISLFLITTLTFFIMKAVPGDPFSEEQALPKEMLEALQSHYGLNEPWHVQYALYLKSLAHGNLGLSLKFQDRTVNAIIKEGFAVSATLGLEAFFIALTGGLLFGTWAALYQNRWQDHLILLLTTFSLSLPSFILASMLQYVFAMQLNLLPIARWGTWSQTILPSIALALLPMGFIARLIRQSMLEVLRSDYIKLAKAKGLSTSQWIFKHALRNAFLPVLSYVGQLLTNLLVGSFVIEKIFSIPGLGRWFITSIGNRDYPVIMGLTLFYSFLLMGAIFLVEMAYGFLDPRIQVEKS